MTSPEEVSMLINLVDKHKFTVASNSQRIALVKKLYRMSFPGIVTDPCHAPSVLDVKNINNVAEALMRVTKVVS